MATICYYRDCKKCPHYVPDEDRLGCHCCDVAQKRSTLSRVQIYNLIHGLARSQGMYGRLIEEFEGGLTPEEIDNNYENLANLGFKDELSVIRFLEEGVEP